MNLEQISSSVILILTIAVFNSAERHNLTTSNYKNFSPYVIPVHYSIELSHINLFDRSINEINLIWQQLVVYLKLKHDDGLFLFHGKTSATINILRSTQRICLNQLHLTIINRANVTLSTKNGIIYVLNKYTYTYSTNALEFPLLYKLLPGLHTFKIEFFGHLTKKYDQSFFRNIFKRNNVTFLIAPYIQVFGMRQLFPCWDIPHLKATFTISIKHQRDLKTISNMPIKYHSTNHSMTLRKEVWTYFYTTPPMSTFQIAIVITKYQRIRISENITLWCECYSEERSLKFQFAQRIINNITMHLKSEFSEINIPKMDHIAIPNFPQDGISKWGIIFHTEANLIYDKTDSVMRKMEVARLIAPKIAYQWFGNILRTTWWSYFWLHDSFATMFGEEAVAKSFNNSEILDFFVIQNQYDSLHLDSHFNMNPVKITNLSNINSIFDFPRYMKAIIILRMYQNVLTDEVFRSNIHTYVSRQIFSSVMSYDFWFMKNNLDGGYYCNTSSNKFLTWIQYRDYPVISWKRNTIGFKVTNIWLQYYNTSYSKWLIPLNLKEIFLKKDYKTCISSYSNTMRLIYFPSDYRMVDIQQAGYYRVKYDSLTWNVIAKYSNDTAGDYESISVINRAKIIDDAFHLMMKRQLNVSVFWNLTQYFYSQETNFAVWYPLLKVFEYLSITFPLFTKSTDIKEKLKYLLENPLKTLGYDDHFMENDLTKCLRQEIVKWACILAYDKCKQTAFRKLEQDLWNPEINPLLSEWKHWTYCNGLAIANSSTLSYVKDIWLKTENHTILRYLICSGENGSFFALSSFFELFTKDRRQTITVIRLHIDIFHLFVMKNSNTYYLIEKILTTLEILKPKQINILTALVDIINHVYSSKNLRKIRGRVKKMNYIDKSQLSKIRGKISTRLSEINTHKEYFQFMKNIH